MIATVDLPEALQRRRWALYDLSETLRSKAAQADAAGQLDHADDLRALADTAYELALNVGRDRTPPPAESLPLPVPCDPGPLPGDAAGATIVPCKGEFAVYVLGALAGYRTTYPQSLELRNEQVYRHLRHGASLTLCPEQAVAVLESRALVATA